MTTAIGTNGQVHGNAVASPSRKKKKNCAQKKVSCSTKPVFKKLGKGGKKNLKKIRKQSNTKAISTKKSADGNFAVSYEQERKTFDRPKRVPNKVFKSSTNHLEDYDENSEKQQNLYAKMFQRPKTIVKGEGAVVVKDNKNKWRLDIQNPAKNAVNLQIQTDRKTIATVLVDLELCGFGDNTASDREQRAAVSKCVAREFRGLLKESAFKRVPLKAHVHHS